MSHPPYGSYNPQNFPPQQSPPPTTGLPPIQPQSSKSGLLVAAIVTVIALAGGAAGGYYFANANSSAASINEVSDEDIEPGSLREGEEDEEEFRVLYRAIDIETPGDPWEEYDESPAYQPGATFGGDDGDIFSFESTDEHLAYLYYGPVNSAVVTVHPDRYEYTIHGVLQNLNSREMVEYQNLHIANINFSSQTVDGQDAILGETTISWWTTDDHEEAYAQVAVLIIDAGAHDAVGGMVVVPEFSEEHYQPAVDLLMEAELSKE